MSRYEFRKPRLGEEELKATIEATIGRLPTEYEVSYDERGNRAEFTLVVDPPLTSIEEEALKKVFPELKMEKIE